MRTLLQNVPLLVFLFIIISIVRAVRRAQKLSTENKAGTSETDEQRRVREIQDRIRRIAAERRGGSAAPTTMRRTETQRPPIAPRPPLVPPVDPFGGPIRRAFAEIERRLQPPEPPPVIETKNAELERQRQLANELRSLEETRMLAQRRAAQVALATKEHSASESGMLGVARDRLLDDLRDPQNLRYAFVLREVLGPPVGLR